MPRLWASLSTVSPHTQAERAVVKDSLSRTLARTGRTIRFADEGEGEEGLGQAQGNDLALPEPDDDDDAATDQVRGSSSSDGRTGPSQGLVWIALMCPQRRTACWWD
jgi:hypothetical protein